MTESHTPDAVDMVVAVLDELLASDRPPTLADRIAWRTARGVIRRARRVSSVTLPAIADGAQRAILVRDALRAMLPALPPAWMGRAAQALDHAEALVTVLGTGGRSSSEPPPEG